MSKPPAIWFEKNAGDAKSVSGTFQLQHDAVAFIRIDLTVEPQEVGQLFGGYAHLPDGEVALVLDNVIGHFSVAPIRAEWKIDLNGLRRLVHRIARRQRNLVGVRLFAGGGELD